MKLYIDTTVPLKVIVRLGEAEYLREYQTPQEQDLLVVIDEALKTQDVALKEIKSIEVNPGPGSFTGTRVGVSVANTFAFALSIPINGQKPPVEPIYSEDPHITKPKK